MTTTEIILKYYKRFFYILLIVVKSFVYIDKKPLEMALYFL